MLWGNFTKNGVYYHSLNNILCIKFKITNKFHCNSFYKATYKNTFFVNDSFCIKMSKVNNINYIIAFIIFKIDNIIINKTNKCFTKRKMCRMYNIKLKYIFN